ncbi:MAG: propionyl-CoA synthetase [Chitinophagaceae bacterium]
MKNYLSDYHQSIQNPSEFWMEMASTIKWFKQPSQGITKTPNNFYNWFEDGELNTCYLAVDRHIEEGNGDRVALYYDSPVTGKREQFTFNELHSKVSKLASALQNEGIVKGDRVVIYLPMIPEAVFSMLACARIGAIHSVVFGGFAPHELAVRIDDAKPKIIISASCGIEIDKVIPYYPMLNDAIEKSLFKVTRTIIVQREQLKVELNSERDIDFNEFLNSGTSTECVALKSTDPLYILYTSGTTGKPKGIVRDNGGHAVALNFSMEKIYNIQAGEVFWAASDIGWVVGHSYIVYGPLIRGCSTVLFEGKPVRTPDAGEFWRIIERYKVSVMFTAPTALRAIKKEDDKGAYLKNFDLSSLRALYLAGERCDVATYYWISNLLNKPIIDHWWQTESGWPIVAPVYGNDEINIKPGSAGKAIPGYAIDILNESGEKLIPNQEGYIAIKLPLPPGCLPTLYKDEDRFFSSYLSTFPGYYMTGDGGFIDDEDFVFIMGRVDDVINVAGHRLSTGEMEEMIASHPSVAECAVIGMADELRGQIPMAFYILKDGIEMNDAIIEQELIKIIRDNIGAVAVFKHALRVNKLPKTRSGKILRRILRNITDGEHYTVPSTIEDPQVLTNIHDLLKEKQLGMAFQNI